jgi:integrase/recombinase XerD
MAAKGGRTKPLSANGGLGGHSTVNSAFFYVFGLSWLTVRGFPIVRQEVPMKEERTTPLRQRMIEDMHIRGIGEKTQKAHTRNVKHFTAFLGRAPDTATPEDLRASIHSGR